MVRKATPLVCVHGLAGSSRWWAAVAGDLEAAGPVALLDLPRALPPGDLPGWVARAIDELGGPVDLVGHSLGGLVALRVAAARPDVVRKLILIAPPGIQSRRSAIAYGPPVVATMLRTRPRFLVRAATDAARAGPRNLLRGGAHVAATDARSEAARVHTPTLLVWGMHDRMTPSTIGREWLQALPDARLHVIEDAGHIPMVEAPSELVAAISAFRSEG
jgi:pyruvate dehydrogenase E2 component (dihydrolipoamide acetyltransferase)